MHSGSASPRPHGQGLAAATSMKRQGRRRRAPARAIETQPVSSGARRASSVSRRNSQSSSRKRTPRWASVASPGLGGLPPPTSPAGLIVWCGARNGRPAVPSAPSRPQALAIRATSSASPGARGGRIEGRRLAASDLPAPGRADHQQAVAARRRHLERVAQVALAAQVGEVGARPRRQAAAAAAAGRSGSHSPAASGAIWRRLSSPITSMPLDQGRLGAVLGRHDQRLGAALAGRLGDRQDARHGAHRAVERQLPDHRQPRRRAPSASCPEAISSADGDRQVEPGAGLAQAGRREVGDDPPQGEVEAAVGRSPPAPARAPRAPPRRGGRRREKAGSPRCTSTSTRTGRAEMPSRVNVLRRGEHRATTLGGARRTRGAHGRAKSFRQILCRAG